MKFFDLTPSLVSIPPTAKGFLQGLAESAGQRLDERQAARADENRWRQTVEALPDNASALSREQMFAIGRDPKLRPYAIALLTGRMRPAEFVARRFAEGTR